MPIVIDPQNVGTLSLRRRPAPKRSCIVHDIMEPEGGPLPVVRHIFYGSTPAAARAIYAAHTTTDEFLRACDAAGRWHSVRCTTRVREGCP